MRAFTTINVSLWIVLFIAWMGYTSQMGMADPTSVQVRLILVVTAAGLIFLGLLRLRRRLAVARVSASRSNTASPS